MGLWPNETLVLKKIVPVLSKKFKYFKDISTSDGKQKAELNTRIAGAGTVMYQLPHLIQRRQAW